MPTTEQLITLTLTGEQVQMVLELIKAAPVPYNLTFPILTEIGKQITSQITPPDHE